MQSGLRGIAAPIGVGNFRYKPPGKGARTRTAQAKLRGVISVKDYGAITVNDTAALAAALAALTGSGALYLPAGTYTLKSDVLSKTLSRGQSIKIYGDGADATKLYFPNAGDGLTFNYSSNTFAWLDGNSMIFEDLGFVTDATTGVGSAVVINGAATIGNGNRPTIFNRCGFHGSLVGNSYWGIGIEAQDLQNLEVNDSFYFSYVLGLVGQAIVHNGSSDPAHPTVLNVHNFQMQFGEVGVHCTGFVEGLNVVQSNFTQVKWGILVDTNGELPMFSATASQFNASEACIQIIDGDACQINGNLFFISDAGSAGKPAIILNGVQFSPITGNTFVGLSGIPTAIILQSGSTDNIIGGNVFKSFSTNIWLQSGANNNVIGRNRHADGTPILDQGTGNIWSTETSSLLTANGGIQSKNPTVGIGYAAGAGGTVVQATSKTTAVTLNKVCGTITMNGAALAAGTIASFIFNNSAIGAADTLILNHTSGGTPGAYTINGRCGAGGGIIDVRNASAGSLSEAIVIQFCLVKGTNS